MRDRRPTSVRPAERDEAPGPATPGMRREVAFSRDGVWVGHVTTEPGVRSGWHHHGETETYFYVLRGSIELEFGPGGRETLSVKAGDFARVPRQTVHREGTTAEQPGEAVLIRIGEGQPVFNVDGPDADDAER